MPDLDLSNWRVLIVDDNQTNLDILSNQLLNMNIRCSTAESALKALSVIEQTDEHFDLVITDMNMPGMDGLTFTKHLREKAADGTEIKVLMLSSMSFNVSSSELNAMGLDGCLLKPVATVDLFNTIKLVATAGASSDRVKAITEQSLFGLHADSITSMQQWPKYHRVLIVEDNAVNLLVAQGLMQQFTLRYDVAANGQEALDALNNSDNNQPFTLILMDCQMPVLDGYSATQKIRAGVCGVRYQGIPIIAMTANALKGDREKCLAAGMNDHVAKPIDSGQLKQALHAGFAITPEHLNKHDMPKAQIIEQASHDLEPSPLSALILPEKPLQALDWKNTSLSLSISPQMYLQSMALYVEQLAHFTLPKNEQEQHSFDKKLHALKGSSGNLGFMSLFSTCLSLEKKSEQALLTQLDIEELNTSIEASIADAKALLVANAFDENLHQTDARSIAEIYDEIAQYAQNNELVPFALVNELKLLAKQNPHEQELTQIIKALEQFDYENLSIILAAQQ